MSDFVRDEELDRIVRELNWVQFPIYAEHESV